MLNLPQFQPLSFEQNNPFLAGEQAGANVQKTFSDTLAQELANRKAKDLLPYNVPQAQADIGYKQTQIGKANKETELLPLETLIKGMNTIRQQSRFGRRRQRPERSGSGSQKKFSNGSGFRQSVFQSGRSGFFGGNFADHRPGIRRLGRHRFAQIAGKRMKNFKLFVKLNP